jgi:hypothetical protein
MMTENSSIMKSHTFFATLGIAFSVGLAPSKTHAATIFSLDASLDGPSSFNLKADGITLTVSNFNTNTGASKADSDGLCIAGVNQDFCGDPSSLYPTLGKQVRLASYLPDTMISVPTK